MSSSATICLGVNDSETLANNAGDYCLGFVDESINPPEWKCQDLCLQSKRTKSSRQLCGETPHFTNFAVLLMGKDDQKRKKNGGVCDSGSTSNGYNYITGSGTGDGLLTIFSIILVFAVVAVVGFLLFSTPCGKKLTLGEEGARIAALRAKHKRAPATSL